MFTDILSWGCVLLVTIYFIAGAFLAYRYYTKRSPDHQQAVMSSENPNGTTERKLFGARTFKLPWWNWRWWAGKDERSSYFPLQEQGP
jgi:hypothetical protein